MDDNGRPGFRARREAGRSSNDSDGIARLYVNELIENTKVKTCSHQQMDQTVKWLSLCGEIDIEERDTVSYLSKSIPFTTPTLLVEALEMLVAKRFAVRRGVKRNVFSIKPDVIREYLVRDWLTTEVDGGRIPSAKSDELVQTLMEIEEGETVPPLTRILKSVAVLEFSQALGGDDIDLLSPFMTKLMNVAEDGSTIDHERVIELVQPFAFARLTEIVELSRTIRLRPRKDEIIKTTFYGDVTLKHENVVLSLPSLLFGIAPYARSYEETKLLYDELVELCKYECQIADLPQHSDGRAKDILPRLFEARRNYLTSYERAAYVSACTLLSDLSKSASPSRAELDVVEIVLRPFMSLERSETTFDGRGTFTIHQYHIALTGPEGKRRGELISTLQGIAAGNCTSPLMRATAWGLLSTARSSAGRVRRQLEGAPDKTEFQLIQGYMKADLAWVLQTIHKLKNIADLKAARRMWEWHIQFEKDPEVMSLAQQCEDIYQAHRLVKRYHTFFDYQRCKEANELGISVAAELAQNGANELNTFLSEAKEFAGPDFSAHRIIYASTHLADHWDQRPFISE